MWKLDISKRKRKPIKFCCDDDFVNNVLLSAYNNPDYFFVVKKKDEIVAENDAINNVSQIYNTGMVEYNKGEYIPIEKVVRYDSSVHDEIKCHTEQ